MSEEEKCRRFEEGLNNHIWAHVMGFCHDDFSKNVERVKKEENERKEKRRGKKNPSQASAH